MDVPGAAGSLSIEVGTNHGAIVVGDHNVVNLQVAPASRLALRSPSPVHRPRSPEGFLDRREETGAALAALEAQSIVRVEGAPGIGKSWFAREAAARAAPRFADGALHLPPGLHGPRDVLQAVFEIFYEAEPPTVPSPTRLRELLAERQALLVLDDATLAPKDLDAILDAARGCRMIVAGENVPAVAGARTVRLGGLPLDDAMQLAEHTFGAALEGAARTAMLARCREAEGHPQRVIEAALGLRPAPSPAVDMQAQRLVLDTVRAFAPHALPRACLGELAGVVDVEAVLTALAEQGLLDVDEDEVRLAAVARAAASEELSSAGDAAVRSAAMVRLGEAVRAEPSARGRALRALPLLWLGLRDAAAAQDHGAVLGLARAWHGPVTLAGYWDGWRELLVRGADAARALGDAGAQAWLLHQSGTRELALGAASEAQRLFRDALRIERSIGDTALEAATLHHLELIQRLGLAAAGAGAGVGLWLGGGTAAKVALGGAALGAALAGWQATGPRLEWSPREVELRATAPDAEPPTATVVVRNRGWRTLPAPVPVLEGDGAASFAADGDCAGRALGRGESCRVAVRFAPATGPSTAMLALRGAAQDARVPLVGRVPWVRLALPERIDFGTVDLAAAASERRVELRNEGDGAATLEGFVPPAAPYALRDDGCRGLRLEPGGVCAATLAFAPASVGRAEATLALRIGAPAGVSTRGVPLMGEAKANGVVAAPASIDFGLQEIDLPAPAQNITLTNHGASPVAMRPPRLDPPGAPFRVSPGTCRVASLGPGEACEFQLSFVPRVGQGGPHAAKVLAAIAGAPAVAVAASGIGIAAQAVLDPPALDFGRRDWPPALPTAAAARTATLSNRGQAALRLSPRLRGPSAAEFAVRSNCPPELAPGARCTIKVDWQPRAAGASDAYLTLAGDAETRLPLFGRVVSGREAVPVPTRPLSSVACGSSTAPVTFEWNPPPDLLPGPVEYTLEFEPGVAVNVGAMTRHVVQLACPRALRWRVVANTLNQKPGASGWRTLSTFRSGSYGGGTGASGGG